MKIHNLNVIRENIGKLLRKVRGKTYEETLNCKMFENFVQGLQGLRPLERLALPAARPRAAPPRPEKNLMIQLRTKMAKLSK
jgi:hypothetical protein